MHDPTTEPVITYEAATLAAARDMVQAELERLHRVGASPEGISLLGRGQLIAMETVARCLDLDTTIDAPDARAREELTEGQGREQ